MRNSIHISRSDKDTKLLGKNIAERIKKGTVVALTGNLGSGKTTFVQGMAEGLGIKQRIISPTFIIMRKYEIKKNKPIYFYHVDLYRLEGNIKSELLNLGLADEIKNEKSLITIEWAEKAKDFLPAKTVWIDFEITDDNERKIRIK